MAMKAIKKKNAAVMENTGEIKEIKKKKAAKKTTVKKKTAKPKSASVKAEKAVNDIKKEVCKYPNAYLVIDHPIEMETIYGSHYAVRIGASTDGYVEISFNDGEWQPCRYDAGYWWFDWTYFAQGHYSIKVKLTDPNGNTILESAPRKCRIC